jgi:catechol 2,3-dioxygenase-like lactoylglutathione lyase family enzyme
MTKIDGLMEIILYVQDMKAQVSFYQDKLGLTVIEPQGITDFSDVYWVEFDTGPCTLVLHGGGQRRHGEDAPKVVFRVEDIEAVRTELIGQGVRLGEVRSPAPEVWVCDGLDPEGNKFSIETKALRP